MVRRLGNQNLCLVDLEIRYLSFFEILPPFGKFSSQGSKKCVGRGRLVQSQFERRRLQACLLFLFNFSLFKFIFLVDLNSIYRMIWTLELDAKILIV